MVRTALPATRRSISACSAVSASRQLVTRSICGSSRPAASSATRSVEVAAAGAEARELVEHAQAVEARAAAVVEARDVERGRLRRGGAEGHDRPARGDARERGGEARAADRLEQQVERLALGLERGDQLVGAELAQALAALGVADHAGDVRAGALGELDRVTADAAGRAGDEHAAAEQRPADLERADRGQARHGERGRGLEGDVVGQLGEPVGGHGGQLGPAALAGEADDAGALARAVGSGFADHAGDVPAGDRPRRARRQGGGPRRG